MYKQIKFYNKIQKPKIRKISQPHIQFRFFFLFIYNLIKITTIYNSQQMKNEK